VTKSSFYYSTPKESPGFLLWQTTVTWQRQIKKVLEPFSLTHPEFVILAVLLWLEEQKQTPIQSTLVEKTKLDKMTVSKILKKFVSEGLVERQEHEKDTRAKCVILTIKGKPLIEEALPAV